MRIYLTSYFKKDLKRIKKRKLDIAKLQQAINILSNKTKLPTEYKDHKLSGSLKGYNECHIESDWLLIYKYADDNLTLILERTGTHSDLF